VRNCTKIGTEALYMEMVMACGPSTTRDALG
jgi:hypothetical protein